MKTILVIEDDISILRGLMDTLEFEGYSVITEIDGQKGLKLALEKEIDMLLLDIMLPGINGHEICRKVKTKKNDLPIIMITAKGSEIDKVTGLDVGADDYVTKPFSIPELLARIRALFRRIDDEIKTESCYSFGNVSMDFIKYETHVDNKNVQLSSKEYSIMKYFINHPNEVINRFDLLQKVWGFNIIPTTRTVDNYILSLRKKLEKTPSKPEHLISIRGVGYKFLP
jgi:DNA-binding response OmpR family regulator